MYKSKLQMPDAELATTRQAIGEASIQGQLAGRVAELEKITLSGAGGLGQASGRATIRKPTVQGVGKTSN